MAAGDYHSDTKLNFFDHMKLYSKENTNELENGSGAPAYANSISSFETNNNKVSQNNGLQLSPVSSAVVSPSRKYIGVSQIVKRNIAIWEVLVSQKGTLRSENRNKKTCFTKTSGSPFGLKSTDPQHCSDNEIDLTPPQSNIPVILRKSKSVDDLKEKIIYSNESVVKEGIRFSNVDTENTTEEKTTSTSLNSYSTSEEKCYTAIETSSESELLTDILSETENSKSQDFETHNRISTSDEEKFSFEGTYTVFASNKNSGHSSYTNNITSNSFTLGDCPESCDIPVDSEGLSEDSVRIDELSYKLKELSKDYDSVIVVRNQQVIWNMQDAETFVSEWHDSSNSNKETSLQSKISNSTSPEVNRISWKICKFCTRAIFPGQAKFESKVDIDVAWHKNCFRCYEPTCSKELRDYDHILYNNEPFCFFHYVERSKAHRCKACKEFIMEERYTYALDHFWHRNHFICSYCKHPLIDSMFVVLNDFTNICLHCHHDVFKKECECCGNLIRLDEWFVHSGNIFWHSNDFCMRCNTCGNSLVDRSRFYRKNKYLYCNRYCSLERGPPQFLSDE